MLVRTVQRKRFSSHTVPWMQRDVLSGPCSVRIPLVLQPTECSCRPRVGKASNMLPRKLFGSYSTMVHCKRRSNLYPMSTHILRRVSEHYPFAFDTNVSTLGTAILRVIPVPNQHQRSQRQRKPPELSLPRISPRRKANRLQRSLFNANHPRIPPSSLNTMLLNS